MIHWFAHTLRGACMGLADAVPGVSGGTLALILGIYTRFIDGISAIGPRMLRAMCTRSFWVEMGRGLRDPQAFGEGPTAVYARHALFLGFLGLGVVSAIVVGARFIPTLLDLYPSQMKGLFFGLVLASVGIPWRMIGHRKTGHFVSLLVAASLAWLLVGLPMDESGHAHGEVTLSVPVASESPVKIARANLVFMATTDEDDPMSTHAVAYGPRTDLTIPSGAMEVSVPVIARLAGTAANVEPGKITSVRGAPEGATVSQPAAISGGIDPALWFVFLAGMVAISAMVLPGVSGSFILLALGLYHYISFSLRQAVYAQDPDAMVVMAIFFIAVAVGITSFSRVLSAVLKRQHDTTMAVLVGLMMGSLRKIWPWTATAPTGVDVNTLPETFDGGVALTLALFFVGALLVTAIDRLGRRYSATHGIEVG